MNSRNALWLEAGRGLEPLRHSCWSAHPAPREGGFFHQADDGGGEEDNNDEDKWDVLKTILKK